MQDLNYELKQMCQRNQDGSFATRRDRERILDRIADQLRELGFKDLRAGSLKPKHIAAINEQSDLDQRSLAVRLAIDTVTTSKLLDRLTKLRLVRRSAKRLECALL